MIFFTSNVIRRNNYYKIKTNEIKTKIKIKIKNQNRK